MDFETLKNQKFSFNAGANIDPRYFVDNGDGSYSVTDLFVYTVAMSVRDKAKDYIFKADTARQYTTESKEKTRPDAWEVKQHELAYKAENAKAIEQKMAEWKKYQLDNPDEFIEIEAFPTGNEDQNRYLAHCRPDITFTSIDDAIGHFLAANACCAKYGKADPARLVVGTPAPASVKPMIKRVSKEEFKEKHDQIKADLDKKFGVPVNDTTEWKKTDACPQETYTSVSFSRKGDVEKAILGKAPATDHLQDFVKVLSENLVGSTPEAYRDELYAKLTDGKVTRSFIASFQEARMALLSDDTGDDEEDYGGGSVGVVGVVAPAWRIRVDDEDDPSEILVRAKNQSTGGVQTIIAVRKTEVAATPYSFQFKVDLADGQSVSFKVYISSMSDVTKAMAKCILLIEDTPFESYKDALQEAYDNYKTAVGNK